MPLKSWYVVKNSNSFSNFREKSAGKVILIKAGTIRKSVDCLIAAVCIHNNVPILHNDRDFSQIVQHSALMSITSEVH
uniref:PIN domain-containing protein n=1 Tax=Endozoicomonas sp. Mp262 TaxID=2919499 RepID=UPI00351B90AF